MAKKYRVKDKNGKYIVTQIYGGHAADGQRAMDVNATLMGKTPAEHCAEMIKKAGGKGNFETKSISHDACNLPAYSFFNGMTMGPEYNYHYKVCEEIELTFKLNNKIVTEKELVKLKGGDNVVITANQEVTWTLLGNNKLEKLVQGKASYSFTMPKTGKFNIKATGKCDPSASKSVAVQIAPQKPKKDFPRDKFIQALYAAMKEFDITSDHETGGFNGLTEGEDKKYSLERWKEISINQKNIRNWLAQHSNNAKAEFAKLSEKDKMNIMYNGMNGNIQPNDGWIYRGRGEIQLTGRGTYQGFADYIKRPDIMTNPDLIAKDIELAARSSAWYWKKYTKASKEAQKGDFVEARKAVNTDADGLRKTPILAKKYLKGQGTIPLRK